MSKHGPLTCDYCGEEMPNVAAIYWDFDLPNGDKDNTATGMYCSAKCQKRDGSERRAERRERTRKLTGW